MGWDEKGAKGREPREEIPDGERRRFIGKTLSAVPVVLTIRNRSHFGFKSAAGSLWSSGHPGGGHRKPPGWWKWKWGGDGDRDHDPPGWDWGAPPMKKPRKPDD